MIYKFICVPFVVCGTLNGVVVVKHAESAGNTVGPTEWLGELNGLAVATVA